MPVARGTGQGPASTYRRPDGWRGAGPNLRDGLWQIGQTNRPFLADRLALSLINLNQVQNKGFNKMESGAVLMDDETRKTVLVAYQKRKQDEIFHPFIEEKVTIGFLFHIQALLFARFLRGDLDGYPPFIWK